jgi:hypothetical protein
LYFREGGPIIEDEFQQMTERVDIKTHNKTFPEEHCLGFRIGASYMYLKDYH